MVCMISYDICSPATNRENVIKVIESIGETRHILTTTYLISTDTPVHTIADKIAAVLHLGDRFAVCKSEYLHGYLNDADWNWIAQKSVG